jgi:hypothetical protein
MEMAGLVIIAWQWLKIGQKAVENRDNGQLAPAFYEEKLRCLRFFYRHELPHAAACAVTLMAE